MWGFMSSEVARWSHKLCVRLGMEAVGRGGRGTLLELVSP